MVKGMWFEPREKVFGCEGHSKCYLKCLQGKGSANTTNPNCGAFYQQPSWATKFKCPRFTYTKTKEGWRCTYDKLGLIAPRGRNK